MRRPASGPPHLVPVAPRAPARPAPGRLRPARARRRDPGDRAGLDPSKHPERCCATEAGQHERGRPRADEVDRRVGGVAERDAERVVDNRVASTTAAVSREPSPRAVATASLSAWIRATRPGTAFASAGGARVGGSAAVSQGRARRRGIGKRSDRGVEAPRRPRRALPDDARCRVCRRARAATQGTWPTATAAALRTARPVLNGPRRLVSLRRPGSRAIRSPAGPRSTREGPRCRSQYSRFRDPSA